MRRQLPPWAMGLAIAPLGFYFGFISTAMPILLAAHGVSVGKIAEVSGSRDFRRPFWAFALCPILDVRFSKRTYAVFFAGVAAAHCLGVSTLVGGAPLPHLTAAVVTTGCAAVVIFGNAHGGWMPDVIEDRHYSQVGGTSNVANLGAAGLFATLAVVLVRTLPPPVAASLLGLAVFAPTVMLFFIPLPAKPTRSAGEMFRGFFGDLYRACKRARSSIVGILCFCVAADSLFCADQSVLRNGARFPYAGKLGDRAERARRGDCVLRGLPGRNLDLRVFSQANGIPGDRLWWRCGGAGADLHSAYAPVFCCGSADIQLLSGDQLHGADGAGVRDCWTGEPTVVDPDCTADGVLEFAHQLHDGGRWALSYDPWAQRDAGCRCNIERAGGHSAAADFPSDRTGT